MSILMIVVGFILGIVILLILVTLHEFAHFVAAKICKAYVYEFSVGWGPKIVSWRRKETVYAIRLIPFGGYVYIASEMTDPPKGREDEKFDEKRYMENIARWKRLLFIVSGAIFNFIIAMFIFTTMFASTGYKPSDMTYWGAQYTTTQSAYLSMVDASPNHLVTQQNVIVGFDLWKTPAPVSQVNSDKGSMMAIEKPTLSVNLVNNKDFKDINENDIPNYTKTVYKFIDSLANFKAKTDFVQIYFIQVDAYHHIIPGKNGDIVYTGSRVKLTGNATGAASVGIAAPKRIFTNSTQAYGYGWKETFEESKTILKSFGLLFTGQWSQLSGPIGIAKTMGDVLQNGAGPFFMYVAMLSANLFVLNLIPIPPLDGYKFVETAIEMVIRKELSRKWKIVVNICGAIVFIGLFVGITIKDIFF